MCVFFFGETRVGTNKFRCFVMMALALFRFSQLLFLLLLLVFLRPPPIPKLDDKKEARKGFFVSCSVQTQRFSRIRTKKRREGNQDGRKSPPEIREEKEEEEEEADSGGRAKVCGNKKGRKRSPPPSLSSSAHSKQQWGIAIVFSLPPTDAFLFFFFCLPPILQLEIYGEGGDVDVGPSLPSSSSSSISFDSRQWKKKWWSGEVWAGPGPTFSERSKVSCSVRRRNLDNLIYKVQ